MSHCGMNASLVEESERYGEVREIIFSKFRLVIVGITHGFRYLFLIINW